MITTFCKKPKFTAMLAMLAAILTLCTGCVRSGVGVIIEPDDTGIVELSVGINEKYINTIKDQAGGVDPFEGKNTATLTDGDESYVCIVEYKEFKNLEELKTILLELEYNFDALEGDNAFDVDNAFDSNADETQDAMWISADGEEIPVDENDSAEEIENYKIFKAAEVTHESSLFGDTYRFNVTTMPHEMNTDDLSMIGISADNMFKLVVAVTMPGTITAEGAQVNANTASFTVTDLENEQVLEVESSDTNITGIIAVGIALIILIVVLIIVFGKKKPHINHEFE